MRCSTFLIKQLFTSFWFLLAALSDALRQGAGPGKIIPSHLSVKQLGGNESCDTDATKRNLIADGSIWLSRFLSLSALIRTDDLAYRTECTYVPSSIIKGTGTRAGLFLIARLDMNYPAHLQLKAFHCQPEEVEVFVYLANG